MSLVPFDPEPAPFGNATGFDTVALDVYEGLARAHGVGVTRGRFPDDVQAEQEAMTPPERDRHPAGSGRHAKITISHDGLKISSEDQDGNVSTSGYRSSYWLDGLTPETLVFDFRTASWEQAKRLAIRGPLVGVTLPAGMVSKLGPIPSYMDDVAAAYMRHAGTTLEATGAERES